MPVLRVLEDEEQGDREDDEGEEKKSKRATQLHNTVRLYSAACHLVFVLL